MKALCIHLSDNFNPVETGLLFPSFLFLEHPKTSHSLKSVHFSKLPHPDAFTQAPRCCCLPTIILRTLCSLIGIFPKSDKKMEYETLVHLCCRAVQGSLGAALTAASHSSGSLAIPALPTLFRWVSPPHWRSPSQRSRSVAFGRWCSTALFNPPIFLSCSSDWGREVFYSTSGQPPATVVQMTLPAFLRSMALYTLALLRSALDRWYFTYQRYSPRSRPDR